MNDFDEDAGESNAHACNVNICLHARKRVNGHITKRTVQEVSVVSVHICTDGTEEPHPLLSEGTNIHIQTLQKCRTRSRSNLFNTVTMDFLCILC